MRRFLLDISRRLLVLSVATLALAVPAGATRTVLTYPVDGVQYFPCANDGAGEEIVLAGTARLMLTVSTDSAGGTHVQEILVTRGVTGVGVTTGGRYRLLDLHRSSFNASFGGFPAEYHLVSSLRLVAMGAGSELALRLRVHATVNANGTPTASVERFSADCPETSVPRAESHAGVGEAGVLLPEDASARAYDGATAHAVEAALVELAEALP